MFYNVRQCKTMYNKKEEGVFRLPPLYFSDRERVDLDLWEFPFLSPCPVAHRVPCLEGGDCLAWHFPDGLDFLVGESLVTHESVGLGVADGADVCLCCFRHIFIWFVFYFLLILMTPIGDIPFW